MKRNFMMLCMLATALVANAQVNMFDAADVDADGWLWFNTQAKIDKYVGVINEEDYMLDPNGKPIQLVYADQTPNFPAPVADPEMYGIGSDGYQYQELDGEGVMSGLDAIKGSIMLPAASANMTYNGGGIALMLPSCVELSIKASSEASFYLRILASKENDANFGEVNAGTSYVEHKWANIKALNMFNAYSAGQLTVSGIETMQNGNYDFTIKSDEPRYVYITHGRKYPVYIHAIKVIKKGDASSVLVVPSNDNEAEKTYNLQGQPVNGSAKGLVVRGGKKVLVK